MAVTWPEKVDRMVKLLGWTRAQFAERLGVPVSTANRWFGRHPTDPSITVGARMARVLGVSADWIFDESADWPPRVVAGPAADGDLDEAVRAALLRVLGEVTRRQL
jgi:transcriptional regulator with XRE-family HTH domain